MSSTSNFFFNFFHSFSYEIPEFQQKVMQVFERLRDNAYWKQIDADKPFDDLQTELMTHVETAIDSCRESELKKLWWMID